VDNVTHTLLGVALANAGLSRRLGQGTTLTLAVASNLPDIDGLCLALGGDAFLFRRTVTHSVFGIIVLSAAAAILFHLRYRHLTRRTLFGLCLLGASLHVAFDLLNSYGVALLAPFSASRSELAWVFIIDLALTGILVAPLMIAASWPQLEKLSRLALGAAALYLAFCGTSHACAERQLDRLAPEAEFRYAFPEPMGAHRFRGVIRRGPEYQLYLLHPWSDRTDYQSTILTDLSAPPRNTERARRLEAFMKAPVWHKVDDEYELFDLRFVSLVIPRAVPFTFRFK
jgi:membrane-bound metal-dependent hydrolase YbcI (DUF457 family)